MSRPLSRMQAECAAIWANALSHAHEPPTWDATDERMREPDEGEAVDERHEQLRVDDIATGMWGPQV